VWPLALAGVLALALLAGIGLAAVLSDGDDATPAASQEVRTIVRTLPGTTEQVTVTAEPAPPPPPPAAGGGDEGGTGSDGVALTDQSSALIRAGDYEGALPVAERALSLLQGSGQLYEAYANYNVGKSLLELGRCAEAIPYFDASEAIQGPRKEINRDRKAAGKCA
ncbi:MAG: hypothetical protein ACRDN6_07495, partial [Gaiellaceae bacterium]